MTIYVVVIRNKKTDSIIWIQGVYTLESSAMEAVAYVNSLSSIICAGIDVHTLEN